eukprot:8622299-Pyramimonas_sp.AAC.1
MLEPLGPPPAEPFPPAPAHCEALHPQSSCVGLAKKRDPERHVRGFGNPCSPPGDQPQTRKTLLPHRVRRSGDPSGPAPAVIVASGHS